jgi:hypothetical protein
LNILTANLLLSTFVFWVAARIYLLPKLPQLKPQTVLLPILLLHSLRHLGLMFLAPGATYAGIPAQFAYPAAFGDLLAAVPRHDCNPYSHPAASRVDLQRGGNARSRRSDRAGDDLWRSCLYGPGVLDSRVLGPGAAGDALPHFCNSPERKDRSMGKLKGKVAFITGGNSGIGLATAKEFVEQGASVVVSGRDQKTLTEVAKELGPDALAVRADVAKLPEIDKLFAAIKAKYGRIDVLFVNAGIGKFLPFEAVTEDVHQRAPRNAQLQRLRREQGRAAFARPHAVRGAAGGDRQDGAVSRQLALLVPSRYGNRRRRRHEPAVIFQL